MSGQSGGKQADSARYQRLHNKNFQGTSFIFQHSLNSLQDPNRVLIHWFVLNLLVRTHSSEKPRPNFLQDQQIHVQLDSLLTSAASSCMLVKPWQLHVPQKTVSEFPRFLLAESCRNVVTKWMAEASKNAELCANTKLAFVGLLAFRHKRLKPYVSWNRLNAIS